MKTGRGLVNHYLRIGGGLLKDFLKIPLRLQRDTKTLSISTPIFFACHALVKFKVFFKK